MANGFPNAFVGARGNNDNRQCREIPGFNCVHLSVVRQKSIVGLLIVIPGLTRNPAFASFPRKWESIFLTNLVPRFRGDDREAGVTALE